MNEPPPEYAGYYRPPKLEGSAEKLHALADAYFGLNKVFIVNVLLYILSNAATFLLQETLARQAELMIPMWAGSALGIGLIIGLLTYPHLRKVAFGKDWNMGLAGLGAFLMGLNSALCCGILGYVVVQQIASNELKKFGIRVGFLGIRKKDVDAAIAKVQAGEIGNPVPPFAP